MSQERVLKAFNDLKEAKVINTDRYIAECQSCRQSILKEVKEELEKLDIFLPRTKVEESLNDLKQWNDFWDKKLKGVE